MTEGKNSVRRVTARLRAIQALELRAGHATYKQIAERLGCNESTALRMVERELERTAQEPADAVRDLEVLRLDRLALALWPSALRSDVAAIDRVLKIMERRARILGLDAPVKLDVRVQAILERVQAEADADEDLTPEQRVVVVETARQRLLTDGAPSG